MVLVTRLSPRATFVYLSFQGQGYEDLHPFIFEFWVFLLNFSNLSAQFKNQKRKEENQPPVLSGEPQFVFNKKNQVVPRERFLVGGGGAANRPRSACRWQGASTQLREATGEPCTSGAGL